MLITRRADFSSSHACYRADWSQERNREVFGSSANPRGHGHNFVLEVTLEGEPDTVTGMVLDLKNLKGIIQREVVDPMDHRFLNHEVPPFDRVVPTTENIAVEIWRRLAPHFGKGAVRLHGVRLWETEDLYVDYHGETP
ncbi:MAG: 6-carboxytetrahydropterin synthase [Acidobacteriia bacterium]|nr:6-carboxytetrahydropterin synthase [Terriglobia bacterium]